MDKLLIISYNCGCDFNTIDFYENILYLFDHVYKRNNLKLIARKCNHSDSIDSSKLFEELLEQVKNYIPHFEYILMLDNQFEYDFDPSKILKFKPTIPPNWILNGRLDKALYKNGEIIPEHYEFNELLFNSNNLNVLDIDLLYPQDILKVSFPFLSLLAHSLYEQCYTSKNLGIKRKKRIKNILVSP